MSVIEVENFRTDCGRSTPADRTPAAEKAAAIRGCVA